jgi:hypothetical protein
MLVAFHVEFSMGLWIAIIVGLLFLALGAVGVIGGPIMGTLPEQRIADGLMTIAGAVLVAAVLLAERR